MMAARDLDLLERLQAVNPVTAGQLDDLAWSEPARALFERIVADDPAAGRRTIRGPRPLRARAPDGWRRPAAGRLAVMAAVLTLSVGAAGYALVASRPKSQAVSCFAAADLRADTAVVGLQGEDPVATCSDLWARGAFGFRSTPALRGCVLASGGVGVFPEVGGGDVCQALGLASLATPGRPGPPGGPGGPVDPAGETALFVAFREAAQARFVGQACVGPEAAAVIVREELVRAGLGGWAVRTATGDDTGFPPERPCASLAFSPEQRTVTLVPAPPTG